MHVAVGRIILKSGASRLQFFWHSMCSLFQARRAEGNVYAAVRREGERTFWSLSVWKTREAMLRYRNRGSHLRAMRASKTLAERIDFCTFAAERPPGWTEAMRAFKRQTERSPGAANGGKV